MQGSNGDPQAMSGRHGLYCVMSWVLRGVSCIDGGLNGDLGISFCDVRLLGDYDGPLRM